MNPKFYNYLFIVLFVIGCTSSNQKNSSVFTGDFFETEKARKLNEEGIELSRQGKTDRGLDKFLQALDVEPKNPTILSNIGLSKSNNSDFEEAKLFFKEALIVSDSMYLIAGVNLGVLYYDTEQFDKGIEILDYVIEKGTDQSIISGARVNRSLNFIGIGDCENAIKDFDYIKTNSEQINNSDFHIKDITRKMKNAKCN